MLVSQIAVQRFNAPEKGASRRIGVNVREFVPVVFHRNADMPSFVI